MFDKKLKQFSQRAAEGLRILLGCFEEIPNEVFDAIFHELCQYAYVPIPELLYLIVPHLTTFQRSKGLLSCISSQENMSCLLSFGANIDYFDSNCLTALQFACANLCSNAHRGIQFLLKNGANPNFYPPNTKHPLILAAMHGNSESALKIKHLFDSGSRVPKGSCALGHILKYSKSFYPGMDYNANDFRMLICVSGLLDAGADPEEAFGDLLETPLMLSVHKNLPRCTEVLISRGASLTAKNANGKTARDYIMSHTTSEFLEIFQIL